jgi:formiminotetrahydrofolate cyclodeaminase
MDAQAPPIADQRVEELTAALASARPAPGGGAAAAITASLGASLTAMVSRLSLERPRYADYEALHREAIAAADAARHELLGTADADAAAYAAYRAARALPNDTETEREMREAASREAARRATEVPLETIRICHAQIELVLRCVGRTNVHAAGDLEVAALLLESAARAAAVNVRANLPAVGDDGYAGAMSAEVSQRLQHIQVTVDRVREGIARGVTPPSAGGV